METEAHNVLISLASNSLQQMHLSAARLWLDEVLTAPQYTRQIWTKAEGGAATATQTGRTYLNQLVRGVTTLDVDTLISRLKDIERREGRCDDDRLMGIVKLDLDLLEYDGQRYHERDWQRAYVRELIVFC